MNERFRFPDTLQQQPRSPLGDEHRVRRSASTPVVDTRSSADGHAPSIAEEEVPAGSFPPFSGQISLHTYESSSSFRNPSRLNLATRQPQHFLPESVTDHVRGAEPRHNSFSQLPQPHYVQQGTKSLTGAEQRSLDLHPANRQCRQKSPESQLRSSQSERLLKHHERKTAGSDRAGMNSVAVARSSPPSEGRSHPEQDVEAPQINTLLAEDDGIQQLRPTVYVKPTRGGTMPRQGITPSTILEPMDHESARPLGLNIQTKEAQKPPVPPRSPLHTIPASYARPSCDGSESNSEKTFHQAQHWRQTNTAINLRHKNVEAYTEAADTFHRGFVRSVDAPSTVFDGSDGTTLNDAASPPDRGLIAWAHALTGFFITFNTWGLVLAFGIFEAFYRYTYLSSTSTETISWIGAIQSFFMLSLGTPIGIAMDEGYFRIFFSGGSVLLVASLLIWSACSTWWQFFIVQGIMQGLSMAMVFCSGTIVLMTYFSTRVGIATAFTALGAPIGTIVYVITFVHLQSSIGFPWTARVLALIAFITLLMPNLVFRRRQGVKSVRGHATWSTFKDAPYLTMCAGLFFAYWGTFFGYFYMPLFAIQWLHLSGIEAVNIVIAMAAASILGRLIPSLLSEKCIGPLNTLIPSCLLSAAMTMVWIGTFNYPSLIVLACFYGFATAGIQALYAPMTHSFSQANPGTIGQRSGVVFTVASLACLTGPPISGVLISRANGGFVYAQIFSGGTLFLGGCLLLAARYMKVGWSARRT